MVDAVSSLTFIKINHLLFVIKRVKSCQLSKSWQLCIINFEAWIVLRIIRLSKGWRIVAYTPVRVFVWACAGVKAYSRYRC